MARSWCKSRSRAQRMMITIHRALQPRHLFDIAVGQDNLFNGDKYRWSLRFTVINLTDKTALYNFLSTFSGTHYVTPRTETVELGFHF